MALGSNLKGKPGSYRVPHSRLFDANVKRAAEEALGLANNQMQEFVDAAKHLSTKRVSNEEVTRILPEVANLPESDEDEDKKGTEGGSDVRRMPRKRPWAASRHWPRNVVGCGQRCDLCRRPSNLAALATTG